MVQPNTYQKLRPNPTLRRLEIDASLDAGADIRCTDALSQTRFWRPLS
jgi:hypothetical protein